MDGRYLSHDDLANTPSRRDGMSKDDEDKNRIGTAAFIYEVGASQLKLSQTTIATALVYFHKFFARRSFARHDRFLVATACLFLASKVEETSRRLREVISAYHKARAKVDGKPAPPMSEEVFYSLRDQVLILEAELMRTISFDMEVRHPYHDVSRIVRKVLPANKTLVKIAVNFVNDSLRTRVCIQYPPHVTAVAAVQLAARYLKVELPTPPVTAGKPKSPWWEVLDEYALRTADVLDVHNQVLQLYSQHPATAAADGTASAAATPSKQEQPQQQQSVVSAASTAASTPADVPVAQPAVSVKPDSVSYAEQPQGKPELSALPVNGVTSAPTLPSSVSPSPSFPSSLASATSTSTYALPPASSVVFPAETHAHLNGVGNYAANIPVGMHTGLEASTAAATSAGVGVSLVATHEPVSFAASGPLRPFADKAQRYSPY